MALTIHYIGNVAWRQNHPPEWNKNLVGDTDTCSIKWQGPQYTEKAFLDSLTDYQSLVYTNENGTTVTDSGMKLTRYSSDDAAIFPTVTLFFEGCRGGGVPDALITNDKTTQSASTTFTITDGSSVNADRPISLSIQYYAARTTYEWVQLSDPAGVPPGSYDNVANSITYSQPPGDDNIFFYRYTGMIDEEGNASKTIPTGDATAVWNSFVGTEVVTSMQAREIVPGHVWRCSATVEFLLIGT